MTNLLSYSKDYIKSLDSLGYCYPIAQEEGNKKMKNKFHILRMHSLNYETYAEAERVAKQYTVKNDEPYAIVQAIAVTKEVVPAIEVEKLS